MARGRMLSTLLVALLLAAIPNAVADEGDVSLVASLEQAPERGWYSSGDVVQIGALVNNAGEATSIDTDPSCDSVLKIYSGFELVMDGSLACLGQSRGLDLGADSTTLLQSLTWDLTDDSGNLVPSGVYTVAYFLPGEELVDTVEVMVQTPFSVPESLELELVLTSRDGVYAEGAPSILTVRLHNSISESIELDFGSCELIVDDEMMGACGPSGLMANQILTIAQIPIELQEGAQTIQVSLGDMVLAQQIEIDVIADQDAGVNSGDLSKAVIGLEIQESNEFGDDDIFTSEISITNSGQEDISLNFSDACRGELWIVDDSGQVVMDTRALKDCSDVVFQNLITPNDSRNFAQPDWTFVANDGCLIAPGELLVVMEIPEHDLFSTSTISFNRAEANDCRNEQFTIDAELSGDEELVIQPSLIGQSDITWMTACGLETTLNGPEGEIDRLLTDCDNEEITQRISDSLDLESFNIDFTQAQEGDYSLRFTTASEPSTTQIIEFTWPLSSDVVEPEVEDDETVEQVESRTVFGTWSATTNQDGTCWLLDSPDEGIITLAGAPGLIDWAPEAGAAGGYVVIPAEAALQCSQFATESFTVTEVLSQQSPAPVIEEEVVVESDPVVEQEEEISTTVVTIGVVIASGGMLSILGAVIATNESWRIPATSAGLWFLGLIGRTSETSDGRYQRGRLMGYLTANPGCHFRALMAALEMSNGQITHHLKVLEQEERIWRRADGRLVRFYPFSSNLHPGIAEEDLPLPPLSPDPNSLQGKILRLLDDDGQMGDYPTQAELAHRLDRSQQLVSHHLRTLQKFGLVEKRKMGVRNRYRLTREATFLLETTDL